MSIRNLSIIAFSGVVIGAGLWILKQETQRKPASVVNLPHFPPVKPWSHSAFSKLNQSMTVSIQSIGGIPDREDQEITLKAEVTLHREVLGEVTFKWDLPDDVELVSGHLSDAWPNLKPGQTAVTEISLLGLSKHGKIKTVNLIVSADGGEVRYAAAGSFANRISKDKELSSGVMKVQSDTEDLQKKQVPGKLIKVHQ
jgi:hypothetical protein